MIQIIFRTTILLAVSGLIVSGAWSHTPASGAPSGATQTTLSYAAANLMFITSAQQTTTPNTTPPPNTTPNMNQTPNPKHPAAAPAGPIPPGIQAGITAMQSAKTSLESAGDKWGGHRIKAIRLINQALKACGQPAAPPPAAANSNAVDNPAALQAGITQLTAAQKHFTSSTNNWGGRKDKALPLIAQALQELQQASTIQKKSKKPKASPPIGQ